MVFRFLSAISCCSVLAETDNDVQERVKAVVAPSLIMVECTTTIGISLLEREDVATTATTVTLDIHLYIHTRTVSGEGKE